MEIGDRIKAERKARGLSQEELARRIPVNKSAVAQWESPNSRTGITTSNLVKVADTLGIPVTRLTGDSDNDDKLETQTPEEAALLRLFRQMAANQQRVHLNLFYSAVGLNQPMEPQGDPSQGGRIVRLRAAKQKT
jgi:transcriptional regulator with XRE-family HTH domain